MSGGVVIVGGGPVGLSAAILLHRAGVGCVVLERDEVPGAHPKARGVRVRTMELFAQWGLAEKIRRGALPPEANRFIYCDSLVGDEIARSPEIEGDASALSPQTVCRVPQSGVEETLRDYVVGLAGVDYRSGVRVVGLDDAGPHVTVRTDDGEHLSAEYVIGADGVSSTVRRVLGVELEGLATLGWGQSIYWQADLGDLVADRLCIQFMTGDRLGHSSSIATVDGRYRWITMVMRRGEGELPAQLADEDAAAIVTRAVGRDVDPKILDIATWRISAQVAKSWRRGRVFLAGDAAHSFPPTGGFGMNTGVQDVHNLVWKLALVINELADARLLDTYEVERKPVAASNAAWSVANGGRFRAIGRAIANDDKVELAQLLDEQRGHVDASAQDLGFGYAEGAVLPTANEDRSEPLTTARTGHRFPESYVRIGSEYGSSVLCLTDRFVLATADAAGWSSAVSVSAAALGVPIGLAETDNTEVLGGHDAVLVRPDGIVAWVVPPIAESERVSVLQRAVRALLW